MEKVVLQFCWQSDGFEWNLPSRKKERNKRSSKTLCMMSQVALCASAAYCIVDLQY